MTFFFELILLLGFSGASFYIGYRYAIDFNIAKPNSKNSAYSRINEDEE
jgi:hypothetical protein